MLKKLRAHLVRQGPALLRLPLSVTPFALQREVLQRLLTWQFQQSLVDGELDFLSGRGLQIEVRDIAWCWRISVEQGRLVVGRPAAADVCFSGDACDLILIAARREDPDTLFFQRRLWIEGDTELGLQVKNLMDSIELESMPRPLRAGLLQLADFIEAARQEGAVSASRAASSC